MEYKGSNKLQKMLHSAEPKPAFLMEAHNALSARIVAQWCFDGIWVSSLTTSATMGLRDCNELTWSELCRIVDSISDAVSIPILVDGDTGYGTFNQARLFARSVEKAGASGVSIEDKVFPKLNSFVQGTHALVEIREFAGKIKAIKDFVRDPSFCVVARTEGFIAGASVQEVVERALQYCEAGADAVFVHSRLSTVDEIAQFCSRWLRRAPVVVAPTTYHKTPSSQFQQLSIDAIIFANHNLRASFLAMQDVCRQISSTREAASVDEKVCSVPDLLAYTGIDELKEAEEKYT